MENLNQSTILIEIDDIAINQFTDQIEQWLGNVLKLQLGLSSYVQKASEAMIEPHIKEAVGKMAEANKIHEEEVEKLFNIIGRDSSVMKDKILGELMTKLEESLMTFQDWLGGAEGTWQYLHHLLILNQQTMGAFAVTEQLGLSIGNKELVKVAFPVIHDKTMHHLLLQEYMLEVAPISILYKDDV